ncbi:MAG: hypothetical protein AAGD32_06215 [Planctomycetota bacterium]
MNPTTTATKNATANALANVARRREQEQNRRIDDFVELLQKLAAGDELAPDEMDRFAELSKAANVSDGQVTAWVQGLAQAMASNVTAEQLEQARQEAEAASEAYENEGQRIKDRIAELRAEVQKLAERDDEATARYAHVQQVADALPEKQASLREQIAQRLSA